MTPDTQPTPATPAPSAAPESPLPDDSWKPGEAFVAKMNALRLEPDNAPSASDKTFGDLTKPHHVPTGVSTGDGVTVPHVAPSQISGELIMAGNMYVGGDPEGCEPVTGYVVKSTEDEMRAVASLPMYRRVAIVPVDQLAQAQAALAAKDREIARLNQCICVDSPKMLALNAEILACAEKAEAERDTMRTLWTEARAHLAAMKGSQ